MRFWDRGQGQRVVVAIEEASWSLDVQDATTHTHLKLLGFQMLHERLAGDAQWLPGTGHGVLLKSSPRSGPAVGSAGERNAFLSVTLELAPHTASELRIMTQSFDVVVWFPTLALVLDIAATLKTLFTSSGHGASPTRGRSQRAGAPDAGTTPRRVASGPHASWPRLFVDMGRMRFFIPARLDEALAAEDGSGDDICVFQVASVHASPEVSAESSRRARDVTPSGSLDALETSSRASLTLSELPPDLQLTVTVHDVAVWSCPQGRLFASVVAPRAEAHDNPALQWNLGGPLEPEQVKVLIRPMTVQLVLVPGGASSASHVADVTVAGGVDCCASSGQLAMLLRIVRGNLAMARWRAEPSSAPPAAALAPAGPSTELVLALTQVSVTLVDDMDGGVRLRPLLHLALMQPILQLAHGGYTLTLSELQVRTGDVDVAASSAAELVSTGAFDFPLLWTYRAPTDSRHHAVDAVRVSWSPRALVADLRAALRLDLDMQQLQRLTAALARLRNLAPAAAAPETQSPEPSAALTAGGRNITITTQAVTAHLPLTTGEVLVASAHGLDLRLSTTAVSKEQVGHLNATELFLAVRQGEVQHVLLDPVNFECTYDRVPRSNDHEPCVAIKMHVNALYLHVGPGHVRLLAGLLEDWTTLRQHLATGPEPVPRTSSPAGSPAEHAAKADTYASTDDLRSGRFAFVHGQAHDHALPGQVVFSAEALAWSYDTPRLVYAVTAQPVPLDLPEHEGLDCELGRWDPDVGAFVPVVRFTVLQGQGTTVAVPEATCAAALEWRVRLLHPPPETAASLMLAGSLCVSSCCPPDSYLFRMVCTMDLLDLELLNHRQDCCVNRRAWPPGVVDHFRTSTPTGWLVGWLVRLLVDCG